MKPKASKLLFSPRIAPYVFVLPFLLTFLVFFLYPAISTVVMSFQTVLPGQTEFIGLENYKKLANPAFFKAVRNSFLYTLITLLLLVPVPMLLATLLNSARMPGKTVFKSVLFVPTLTSIVVAGTIFRLAFAESDAALMNSFLGLFGAEPVRWLRAANTGFVALTLLALWRWLGINMLYYLAGLQGIPADVYESASIDGANAWQKFRHITVPMLRPVTTYVLTITIYGGLAMFTESYMLWGGNKSPNDIGLTIVGYLYRTGLEQNNFGFASAVGVCLLAATLLINTVQLKLTDSAE